MDNIPRHLEEQLRHRKVIPFVGAGVSMEVRGKETGERLFPSWKELLESAVARLGEEEKPDHVSIVRGLAGLGPDHYLEAAERARDGLKGALWFRFLDEELNISRERVDDDSLDLARAI